jgi:hypothetical protein
VLGAPCYASASGALARTYALRKTFFLGLYHGLDLRGAVSIRKGGGVEHLSRAVHPSRPQREACARCGPHRTGTMAPGAAGAWDDVARRLARNKPSNPQGPAQWHEGNMAGVEMLAARQGRGKPPAFWIENLPPFLPLHPSVSMGDCHLPAQQRELTARPPKRRQETGNWGAPNGRGVKNKRITLLAGNPAPEIVRVVDQCPAPACERGP